MENKGGEHLRMEKELYGAYVSLTDNNPTWDDGWFEALIERCSATVAKHIDKMLEVHCESKD